MVMYEEQSHISALDKALKNTYIDPNSLTDSELEELDNLKVDVPDIDLTATEITPGYLAGLRRMQEISESVDIDVEEEVLPTEMSGSNILDLTSTIPDVNYQARKHTAFNLMKMRSADTALTQSLERWVHRDDPTMSPQDAEMYAEALGAPIKFDKPMSEFSVRQAAETYRKRETFEQTMAGLQTTGSQGFARDAVVMAAGLAGSIGPVELTSTAALGWALPLATVGVVAKTGQLTSTLANAKKLSNVASAVRRFKTQAAISKAASAAEGTVAKQSADLVVKATKAKNAKDAEKRIKAMKTLEEIADLKYESLTNVEKTGLDVLATQLVDVNFINNTRLNAEVMGMPDLYTEQDALIDSLGVTTFGAFLPGGIRFGLERFGFTPKELAMRRMDNVARNIDAKEALGEISSQEAIKARKAVATIRTDLESGNIYKKPGEYFINIANDLSKVNMSRETLVTNLSYSLSRIYEGNVPKVSDMYEFESILSHIDSRVLAGLKDAQGSTVFGTSLIREASDNMVYRAKVEGDTGLLGSRSVTALSREGAEAMLDNMYKGYILGDQKALRLFKEWVNRFETFTNDVRDIWAAVKTEIRENTNARATGSTTKKPWELIELEPRLEEAYRRYIYGRGADSFKKRIEAYNADVVLNPNAEIDSEVVTYLDSFNNWYARFANTERVPRKDGKGYITKYDFVNFKGEKDYGDSFGEYIKELEEGVESNRYLATADERLSEANAEKINAMKERLLKYDVSSDTDTEFLFGAPRATFEEARTIEAEVRLRDVEASLAMIDYNKLQRGDATIEAFKAAKASAEKVDPALKKAMDDIDSIKKIKDGVVLAEKPKEGAKQGPVKKPIGLATLKNRIIKNLHDDLTLQTKILENINDNVDFDRTIGDSFRTALKTALNEDIVSEYIGNNTRKIVESAYNIFKKEIEVNPEKLRAFLTPENLQATSKAPEFGGTKQKIEEVAGVIVDMNSLLEPALASVRSELSRVQVQNIHYVRETVNKVKLMMEHPESASEILTGAATQTINQFGGSRRSSEYLSKTSGYYRNDIVNQLSSEKSADGKRTLFDVYTDSAFKDEIQDALIYLKHGENVSLQDNTDAARIATILANQYTSFQTQFARFGAEGLGPISAIRRSNLRYADKLITDTVEQEMKQQIDAATSFDVDNIIDSLPRIYEADVEMVRRGDRNVLVDAELTKDLGKAVSDLKNSCNAFFNIENPLDRKVALWALKSMDLDRMFDRSSNMKLSLNAVRDAMFTGDWEDVLRGDAQNLIDAATAAKWMRSKIIGTTDGAVDVLSWVTKFRTGFDDLGAVINGEKAAAVDAYEGSLIFKNAQEEIEATRMFGYDTVDDYVQHTFDDMFQRYYTLENFGYKPIQLVQSAKNIYNSMFSSTEKVHKAFRNKINEYAKKNKKYYGREKSAAINRFKISQSQFNTIEEHVLLASGLQNTAPSSAARVIKVLKTFLSAPLLMKAGLKSLSDYSTIMEGFISNGLTDGRIDSLMLLGSATKQILQDRDLFRYVLASTVLQHDEILRRVTNDPGAEMMSLAKAKDLNGLDWWENASRLWADALMNKFARLGYVTNHNKSVAALGIQMAIGKKKNTSFNGLGDWFKLALERESISENDWDFIRKYAVVDLAKEAAEEGKALKGESFDLMNPFALRRLSDEDWAAELAKRGELNISPERIKRFKTEMISKVWNMVETASDEMVSIPSNRIMSIMRGGRLAGSKTGTTIEVFTQYQSFGAALLFNMYGRRLANFAAAETGVSPMDILNPNIKLLANSRPRIYSNLFGMMCSVGTSMLIIDSITNALSGNIQQPISEDGKVQPDMLVSSFLGALGVGGTFIDALAEGVGGAGQKGGGFSIQVAPALSNLTRMGYRLGKPIFSTKVKDKPKAVSSALVQEISRFTGLRSAPIVGPVWQMLVGAWLDENAAGGSRNYQQQQKARERRGMMIMPWEEDPRPIWERLQ